MLANVVFQSYIFKEDKVYSITVEKNVLLVIIFFRIYKKKVVMGVVVLKTNPVFILKNLYCIRFIFISAFNDSDNLSHDTIRR